MGRHRPNIETNEDGDTVRISGKVEPIREGKGDRTFERDSGGVQGFEYFGVGYEEDK